MSKGRLEAFSDGVFAIIITIIVLGMTLPDVFTAASTQAFLWEIFIFIEGGLIIGQFWYSHSRLFDQVTFISTSAVLFNILFFISFVTYPIIYKSNHATSRYDRTDYWICYDYFDYFGDIPIIASRCIWKRFRYRQLEVSNL